MNDLTDVDDAIQRSMVFMTATSGILDMLDGYRAQLANRGYSDGAQEIMVVHMHEMILKGGVNGS